MSTLKTGDTGEYNRITAYWEENTEEPETAETFKLIDELLEAQCEWAWEIQGPVLTKAPHFPEF